MAAQLVLIDARETQCRLDDHTREVGRRGLAEARRRLEEAVREAVKRSAA
jgi:hypothetical protein